MFKEVGEWFLTFGEIKKSIWLWLKIYRRQNIQNSHSFKGVINNFLTIKRYWGKDPLVPGHTFKHPVVWTKERYCIFWIYIPNSYIRVNGLPKRHWIQSRNPGSWSSPNKSVTGPFQKIALRYVTVLNWHFTILLLEISIDSVDKRTKGTLLSYIIVYYDLKVSPET